MWFTIKESKDYARTSQDMDGALHTDFANFYTIWGIARKISALLQLRKKWILTKFEGRGSKNEPATVFENYFYT